jgi:uncharacterized membrane protein YfcA
VPDLVLAVAIGFVAGVLSGAFGIGGGVIMVPALRILLGVDGLTAVGTSLPVIFPSALTGAISYARAGASDLRGGLRLGLFGVPFAVLGAFFAEKVGGTVVLVVLSVVIVWMAADTILQIVRPREPSAGAGEGALSAPVSAGVGGVTGLYSGFLGLGGGFIMVPLLTRWGRMAIKRAIGTSLVAILLLAIPGTVTHYAYGNTDVRLSLALMIGVVPGAMLGSRITLGANERSVRIAFACMLVVTGVLLIAKEIGWL